MPEVPQVPMATIGVIGGMGWQSTALYYRVMNRRVQTRLGGLHSARVLIDSLDFAPIAGARDRDAQRAVRQTLVASAERLQSGGAALVVMACNTVHRFAEDVQNAVDLPVLHIADVAATALRAGGHRRVGLLGTRATMQGRFYARRMQALDGPELRVPDDGAQRALGTLIEDELAFGVDPTRCAPRIEAMVAQLAEAGCDAVLLACTELGLAFANDDSARIESVVPLYDTAVLHAQAAVDLAFELASPDF